ncbi:GNAT family N-acetyltransferase [Salmonella enterica subsp. enterica serovar Kentucky]|nr:GNAT family N-acetyltransferase [Salmonella enterica subsp. enterica serovar Kentucky]
MTMLLDCRELHSETELKEVYPIMRQLRPHLDETSFVELVKEAREAESYTLFALYEGDMRVALAGFLPRVSLNQGRHVWVADLVTCEKHRSKGFGKKLLGAVEEWAKRNGLASIALSSGVQRADAHRFYEDKMEYKKASYLFRKALK